MEIYEKNPEWTKERVSGLFKDDYYLNDLDSALPKAPVTFVSWFAARAYCKSKGLRLPTTNEWEYVAAASEKINNANKEESFLRRILNWYAEPQGERLKDIGSIYKNIYGVWDMHGLVWEWVDDFNSNFVTGESREDGSFNKDMFCGAGALSSADKENYAAFMRFAFRSGLKGKSSTWNLGFRCAK
jgi:formylglycine-generating enzyme required for sulfatase activity